MTRLVVNLHFNIWPASLRPNVGNLYKEIETENLDYFKNYFHKKIVPVKQVLFCLTCCVFVNWNSKRFGLSCVVSLHGGGPGHLQNVPGNILDFER